MMIRTNEVIGVLLIAPFLLIGPAQLARISHRGQGRAGLQSLCENSG
jgi:hypothetical protein